MLKSRHYHEYNMTQPSRKAIAIYEIVGGALGLAMSIWIITKSYSSIDNDMPVGLKIAFAAILIFPVIIYILSILAGTLLIRNSEKGLNLSILVQAIQLPYFVNILGLSYYMNLGLQTVFSVSLENGTHVNLFIYLGKFFNIDYVQISNDLTTVGINILALLILVALLKIRKNNL